MRLALRDEMIQIEGVAPPQFGSQAVEEWALPAPLSVDLVGRALRQPEEAGEAAEDSVGASAVDKLSVLQAGHNIIYQRRERRSQMQRRIGALGVSAAHG